MRLLITCIFTLFTLYAVGQNTDKYDRITDSLTRSGDTTKLIAYFQKELKAYPKNENVLRRLGYLYIKTNQYDLGKKYYEEVLALNPKCVRCITNIGLVYEAKGDYKKALECLDKAIAIDPANPISYSNRAHLKENSSDNSGALADYDKAVALDFENAGYYVQRGNFHFKQGSFALAIADMNRSVQLAPDNYFPYYRRSIIYFESHKLDEAFADVNKALQLDSTQQELYSYRGAVYASVEEHDKAIADYSKAIQLKPDDYLPYYNLSLEKHALEDMDGYCTDMQECYTILKKDGQNDSLKNTLQIAIASNCDSTQPGYFYQRGIALFNLQQYKRAIDIYTAGIRKFPDNVILLSFRGNAHFAMLHYTEAIEDYYASGKNKVEIAQQAEGFLSSMQVSIAEAKFMLGKYEEALTDINKAIEMLPVASKSFPTGDLYNTQGSIFLALGKYQEALTGFNKCIELNPSFAPAYLNRAVARLNLSNKLKLTTVATDKYVFNTRWMLPLKTSLKNTDDDLFAALSDCSKAINMNPDVDFAYYLRGRIKKMLEAGGQCDDFIKAKDLGYPVEPELMRGCRQ
jgi:tetratricopeptide (TPR) repeat protein